MGFLDRAEDSMRGAVQRLFARAFHEEVQPVEIAGAIRNAMDDRATLSQGSAGPGRSIVPNLYQVEVSESDYERLSAMGEDLREEIIAAAEQHAETQRYQPGGPFDLYLVEDADLETGVFRIRPSTSKHPRATGTTGGQPAVAEDSGRDNDAYAAPPVDPYAAPPVDPYAAPPPTRPKAKPADRPWLDHDGDRYPLLRAMTTLGRDDRADVILDDPGISRRHSEIRVTTDGRHWVASIRDLGSTNGTFVNGERITSEGLHDGDRITVGRTTITYRAGRL